MFKVFMLGNGRDVAILDFEDKVVEVELLIVYLEINGSGGGGGCACT